MDRRIFGIETEYGVTCTFPGSTSAVSRRGGPLPVPPGRLVGAQQQRVPAQRRPALPRRRQPPRVRDARSATTCASWSPTTRPASASSRAARRRRAAPARGGHPRRRLPLQEQHRLRRELVRLPRELPGDQGGRLRQAGRRPHPLPGQPAAHLRRGQGPADPARRRLLPEPARRAHLGGRLERDDTAAGRSSTPATSRTPTPSATGGCTSSWATRTWPSRRPCSRSARPTSCCA